VAVTHAHRSILAGDRMNVIYGLSYAIFLGLLFTLIQFYEYVSAPFNINDGIYGSLFYVLTGFHGIHVIVGTVFLFVTLIRHIKYHLLVEHHLGLETSI
jgi:heme/copper-type cytochrome/quinol oxidase subunit 3